MLVQTDAQKAAAYAAAGLPAPTTPPAAPATPTDTTPTPTPTNTPTGTTAPSGGTAQPSGSSQTATMPANGSIVDLLNQTGTGSSYADRQKLAQQFGVAGYHGTAAQNTDLAKKYLAYFNSKKGTEAPATNPRQDIQQATDGSQRQPDPQQNFIDQYATMNPVMKTMYDMINQVLSPQNVQQTFTQEYQSLIAAQGIPALQTNLMNIQNVMNGTEDDIRTEITKAGGFATESQVQALAATRNKVLLKQANTMSQTLQMKEDYVNQVMQFSQADRTQVNEQVNQKIGLVEKMATIQDTINKNAQGNYTQIVNNLGYTGLAKAFDGNPQGAAQAERLLSLPQGALTDQAWLSQAETLRQQTLSARTGQYDVTNALAQERLDTTSALAQERLNQSQQKINITIGNAQGGATGAKTQAQMLVDGTLAPSQLSKRSTGANSYGTILAEANALSMEQRGVPFDAKTADAQFAFQKSTKTQFTEATLKYTVDTLSQIKGLSDKVERGKITFGNQAGEWLQYQGSDINTVNFITKVNGAIDDVAAALGGGVSTDAKLIIAKKLIDPKLSKAAFTSQINTDLTTIATRLGALQTQSGQPITTQSDSLITSDKKIYIKAADGLYYPK